MSPPPLSPASVPLPPRPKGGGHTRLRVRGWGSPNSNDWRKSLALCLLSAWCFKQIWKVGKVGRVGKVGKVGKAGKEGGVARVAVANSLPDFTSV